MKSLTILPALCLITACVRPETTAVAANRTPVAVVLSLPATAADRGRLEGIYAEAIRQQLGSRVNVLAAGAGIPGGAARLLVTLSVEPSAVGSAGAQGSAFGGTFGTAHSLGAGKGLLPSIGDGILTGMVLGAVSAGGASLRESYHAHRLGYRPNHIDCEIAFQDAAGPVRVLGHTGAWAVVQRMQPLSEQARLDPDGLRKEEARALAEVVTERMEKLGWTSGRDALAPR